MNVLYLFLQEVLHWDLDEYTHLSSFIILSNGKCMWFTLWLSLFSVVPMYIFALVDLLAFFVICFIYDHLLVVLFFFKSYHATTRTLKQGEHV